MSKPTCLVPGTMPPEDAEIYLTLRGIHCDRKKQSHECSGRMIIDRNGLTLACPLCGDSRALYPPQASSGLSPQQCMEHTKPEGEIA